MSSNVRKFAPERTLGLRQNALGEAVTLVSSNMLNVGQTVFRQLDSRNTHSVHLYTTRTTTTFKERAKLRIKNGELVGCLEHISNLDNRRKKERILNWKVGAQLVKLLLSLAAFKSCLLKDRMKTRYASSDQEFNVAVDTIIPLNLGKFSKSGSERSYIEVECFDPLLLQEVIDFTLKKDRLRSKVFELDACDAKWMVAMEAMPTPKPIPRDVQNVIEAITAVLRGATKKGGTNMARYG